MMAQVSGRVALITGASRGIGLASAIAFAEAGDCVYATARNVAVADAVQSAARRSDIEIHPVELDVTRTDTIKSALETVIERHGTLDVLVNNAGILRSGAFETLTDADIRAVMETNFFGALNVTRAALPVMRAQGRGRILMMSSLSGWAGLAGDSIYAASKFALEGFTEALRHEVARWGIRLDLIEPAGYRTGLLAEACELAVDGDAPYAEFNQKLRESLTRDAGQGGDPMDVARALVEISRTGSNQYRWPVGDVAERLHARLFADDDDRRDALLKAAAEIEWWVQGDAAPGSN